METKYLYGASVQGIQGFIFETNKLTEIAGASELVERICTDFFAACIGINDITNDDNLITGAAGNIKYVFDNKENCQNLVMNFPKKIMDIAPGIAISQAVVKLKNNHPTKEDVSNLERKLRIQRNRPITQHGLGLMISERSRRTGKAGINGKNGLVRDKGQRNKEGNITGSKNNLLEKLLGKNHLITEKNYPYDITDLVKNQEKSWIAVVHADGNNLGKLILDMSNKLKPADTQEAFRKFSILLDEATTTAAANAFDDVIAYTFDYHKDKLPIRPVILGGDDLTVIIRGDLALPFTTSFLEHFEKETKNKFSGFATKYPQLTGFDKGLTACAGIAYIKVNYPFHYGVKLCEELCKNSKKIAKNIDPEHTPSCLTFHKVHSSFIDDYSEIIAQELKAKELNFNYGPYFLKKQPNLNYATVDELNSWVYQISKKDAPQAPLRNWLGELKVDKARADQSLERIMNLNGKYVRSLNLSKDGEYRTVKKDGNDEEHHFTHIFDVLTIAKIAK